MGDEPWHDRTVRVYSIAPQAPPSPKRLRLLAAECAA
jgi:hypothetical protein